MKCFSFLLGFQDYLNTACAFVGQQRACLLSWCPAFTRSWHSLLQLETQYSLCHAASDGECDVWAVPSPYTQSYGIYAFLFHCYFRSVILLPELLGLSPRQFPAAALLYFIQFPHTVTREVFRRFSSVQNTPKIFMAEKPNVVQTWSPIITPVQNLCAFSSMQFALGAFVNGPQPGLLPFLVNGDFALKPFWTNKIRGQLWTQGSARSL